MVCCWWCCHPFEGEHHHMPYDYDYRLKRFSTTGIFCSWECMKAHALDKYPQHKSGEICTFITLMKRTMVGKTTPIKTAPNRFFLEMFGGTMTIEEFRKNNHKHTWVVPSEKFILPFVLKNTEYKTSQNTERTEAESSNKFNDIMNTSTKGSETLKLKRSKPLKREAESTLERSLGIVVKS